MRRPLRKTALASILFAGALLAVAVSAGAQQPKKVARIGYLGGASLSANQARVDAFQQRLRELGYIEGQNIAIEYRYAQGVEKRLLKLTAELVQLNVDVILPVALPQPKQLTMLPIVMTSVTDPVGAGLVASLAHPGGNVTGVSNLLELSGKQLELLKEAFPKVTRVAVIWEIRLTLPTHDYWER